VLITLAIIGVIAAITIPSIVANHKKRTLETQFAKAYRNISHAVNMAVAEHGGIDTWAWKDSWGEGEKEAFVKNYFLPYFNVVKYCNDKTIAECFGGEGNYKNLSGGYWQHSGKRDSLVMLADGMSLMFYFPGGCISAGNKCMDFIIDLNGSAKKPNMSGGDTFLFSLYPQTGEFLPLGIYKDASYNEETKSFTKRTVEEINEECERSGFVCAAKIVLDGFKVNYEF